MVKSSLILAKPALLQALAPHSFVAQCVDRDLDMVRKSETAGLFEHVEFEVAGRGDEVIVVGLAVSVVWWVVTQMRGLRQSGGLPEVCSDPNSGKVRLATKQEAEAWAAKVGAIAPKRAAALAYDQGPALLRTTEVARSTAADAFRIFVESTPHLLSIREGASTDQKVTIDNALTRPFAVPAPELQLVSSASIAALVRMGDPDVIELGQIAMSPSPDPSIRIQQLKSVSELAIWKVRILIDMILQRDREVSLHR
ncbi:MAG: hypothetical protein AB7T06_36505 [Kofleriaceae bacterium]